MLIANLGVSTPVFVLGLVLAYFFAVVLKDTPSRCRRRAASRRAPTVTPLAEVWGLEDLHGPPRAVIDFLSNIYTFNAIVTGSVRGPAHRRVRAHMILPAFALGTIPLAIIARMTRSSLLDDLGLDYVRTARAKGLRDRRSSCATASATRCCRS